MKRGYSANPSIISPPEKKPNIEELKEYTEAHRMRKELIVSQEVDEEIDYYAEDFQNADDDDDDENAGGNDSTTGSVVIKRLFIWLFIHLNRRIKEQSELNFQFVFLSFLFFFLLHRK